MRRFFIEVKDLEFFYQKEQPLFLGFCWKVERGEAWAVIGPSGSGKSTLLFLLAGLLKPKKGEILIDGQLITRPRPETALILQDFGLLPWSTVRENVALGLKIRSFYGPDGVHAPKRPLPKDHEKLVDHWLDRLNLKEVATRYPFQVSGGQKQRVAIARALVLEPNLLLMDEPFSSLDAPTREDLEELTLKLQKEKGLTVITVTHNVEEAAFLGRKILCLKTPPHREPLILEGPPPERDNPIFHQVCNKIRNYLKGYHQ